MSTIALEGVGKRYRQYSNGDSSAWRRILRTGGRAGGHDMWALRDISFSVEAGKTLGIIGRNGSGKTTLLRLLAGVSAPTTGRMRVEGTIAPLIGIGVGFNPELTGRENVTVNGRLLGMTDALIKRDFDAIVDFSEIEDFIETPVKYYSSGMFLRLAFAVAVFTRPEVLIVDEVLAVGDLAFQLKCNDKMREIQEGGATIVIVTHNLQQLPRLTDRAILLNHGTMRFDGPVEDCLGAYHEVIQNETPDWDNRALLMKEEGKTPRFVGGATMKLEFVGADGLATRSFTSGAPIRVRVNAEFSREIPDPLFGIMVAPIGLGGIYHMHTQPGDYSGVHDPDRPLVVEMTLDNPLLGGGYTITAGLYDRAGTMMIGSTRPESFHVSALGRSQGIVDLAPKLVIGGTPVDGLVDQRNLRRT